MTNKRYEFDNRKPSAMSRIGSTVIAVGSVATAISIAMPSVGAFVVQETAAVGSAFGIGADGAPAINSGSADSQGAGAQNTSASGVSSASVAIQAEGSAQQAGADQIKTYALPEALPTAIATSTTSAIGNSADPVPTTTITPTTTIKPTTTPTSKSPAASAPLAPLGSVGSVSSPTPTAGGGSASWSSPSGSTTTSGGSSVTTGSPAKGSAGNLSSPTPAGSSSTGSKASGGYYDDDHDDDRYDDHDDHDDHDDD